MNNTTTTTTSTQPKKTQVTWTGITLMYAWTFNKDFFFSYEEALTAVRNHLNNEDSFIELATKADAIVAKGLDAYRTEIQKAININN